MIVLLFRRRLSDSELGVRVQPRLSLWVEHAHWLWHLFSTGTGDMYPYMRINFTLKIAFKFLSCKIQWLSLDVHGMVSIECCIVVTYPVIMSSTVIMINTPFL